ncbi:MAG TPA: DUF4214 domain-containing protein [Pirellulales bacterium]
MLRWFSKLRTVFGPRPRRMARPPRRGIEPLEARRLLIAGGADTPGSVEMQFVSDLFQEVLHRTPTAAETSYFLNEVDQGVPFSTVINQFLTSSEYHADQIAADYNQYLHRVPDAAGAAYWLSQLNAGVSESQFDASLLGSQEYYADQGGTNSGFISGLYNDVLGRTASAADLSFWNSRLAAGESRHAVAGDFLNSPEHRAAIIDSFYHDFLGRGADPGALNYWENFLAGGGSLESFEQSLLLARLGPEVYHYAFPQDGGLSAADVQQLLQRAAAASSTQDAIIAVVDRGGHILGVRTEAGVDATYAGRTNDLIFAIDGAVSLARTAAFFSNNAGALTSRTVRFISQSTITEREVDSNPNVTDLNSPVRGPGFVAPIGLGAHFPPDIAHTPPVDLFGIEDTNRDSILHPDANGVKAPGDVIPLAGRFNIDPAFVPPGQQIDPPESYGYVSGENIYAQSRGIATLPGGVPIYKNGVLVGGIGVFFPGPNGYATYEEGFVPGMGQTTLQLTNAPLVLQAEWMAFAAAADDMAATAVVGGVGPVPGVGYGILYQEQINLVGVQLETFGPNPTAIQVGGIQELLIVGAQVGRGNPTEGTDQPVDSSGTRLYEASRAVPDGWIVIPHDSPTGELKGSDVFTMITQGIAEAGLVRSAIREMPNPGGLNPSPGPRSRMILSVTDKDGNVLGLYRMPDATVFSFDVAVSKARNVSYFSDPTALQPIDELDPLTHTLVLPPGAAYTNRTFRFLADPRYPDGVDGTPPGPFSILWDPGVNPSNGEDTDPNHPVPASAFQSVLGYDAFHPETNFRDPRNIANQSGVIFFPGSAPVYKNNVLVGGLGISGDGVDQDDVVTAFAAVGYDVPATTPRADDVFVRGVRLPYQKFNRNPEA